MINYKLNKNTDLGEKFIEDFNIAFSKMIREKQCSDIVFLCVGTDRITGDCFGPLVGSKLQNLLEKDNYSNINIYGSLEKNINYKNIESVLTGINSKTGIIVVDAALSKKENIGKVFVSNSKTTLGKGLAKNRIELGDISIKTVVAKDYKTPIYNFKGLQNIPLNTVISLANIVSEGIYKVLKQN